MILEHYSDIDWLRLAFRTAADFSDDPRTQNGAVLVPRVGYVASAANCLPKNIAAAPSRLRPPEKYTWVEHAERGAIYAAARAGTKTESAVLYACWVACPECARAIIESGVREVVSHIKTRALTPSRWEDRVLLGERMLEEAGVSMRWLNASVGVSILFDGVSVSC